MWRLWWDGGCEHWAPLWSPVPLCDSTATPVLAGAAEDAVRCHQSHREEGIWRGTHKGRDVWHSEGTVVGPGQPFGSHPELQQPARSSVCGWWDVGCWCLVGEQQGVGPPHGSLGGQFLLPAWLWSVVESVEEVGGRLQDVELYAEWEKKCQVVAVSLQQRELPPRRGYTCLGWRFLLLFHGQRELHSHGLLDIGPAGASGAGGSQGAFLLFSRVPLLLLGYGLCLSLSLPCSCTS